MSTLRSVINDMISAERKQDVQDSYDQLEDFKDQIEALFGWSIEDPPKAEKLMTTSKYCIVFYGADDKPYVKAAMYDHNEKKWFNKWMQEVKNVICWMPLEKIPKQK